MKTTIKTTTIKVTKNKVTGQFKLSDKTATKFEVDRKTGEWQQWNNTTENLCVTVEKIEQLAKDYFIY